MNQQQPFGMIPVPVPFQAPDGEPPPARVLVALRFLDALVVKTRGEAFPTGVGGVHEIEGQKLTDEERITQVTALKMLHAYFAGELQPSQWEIFLMKLRRGQLTLIDCPTCHNDPGKKAECPVCRGNGKVVEG